MLGSFQPRGGAAGSFRAPGQPSASFLPALGTMLSLLVSFIHVMFCTFFFSFFFL